MRNAYLLGVVLMLVSCAQTKQFMSGITAPKSFELIDKNQRGFMSMSAVKNGTQLTLEGTIRGQVVPSGDAPESVAIQCALGDDQWKEATMNGLDYHCALDGQHEDAALPLLIPIKIRIAWKEQLAATGKAYQATPDNFEFALRLDSSADITLLNGSEVTPSANLSAAFKYVEDKQRLAEIERDYAEQKRWEAKLEREAKTKRDTEQIRRERFEEVSTLLEQVYQREIEMGSTNVGSGPWGTGTVLGRPDIKVEWLDAGLTSAKVVMDAQHWAKYLGTGFIDVLYVKRTRSGWKLEEKPKRTIVY